MVPVIRRPFFTFVILLVFLLSVQAGAQSYSEAPMLAERVAAGELPAVEERLPAEPLVIEPVEEIGSYGGTARLMHIQVQTLEDGMNLSGKEAMLRFDRDDGQTILPNLASSWSFTEDARTLTLRLREGIKWSDGHPFTADDIMFMYEDVLLNEELTPVPPTLWSPGGELMTVSKIDDYTVELNFAVPYAAAEIALAAWATSNNFFLPKHYMQQFHPNYVSEEELAERTRAEGFNEWYELFGSKRAGFLEGHLNLEIPVIRAYKPVSRTDQQTIFERNPYYWKIDTEGNQLPYIDRIQLDLIQNSEVYTLRAISGDVDLAQFYATVENVPVYQDNLERGNYRLLLYEQAWPSVAQYYINMTHLDPRKREIFGDKRFRVAMALAINRDEINDVLFFGSGEPMQTVIIPRGGRFWDEELAKMYTEYEPDEANRLLDEMGLTWSGQYRTMPDGSSLVVVISYWAGGVRGSMSELVRNYWEAVGVQTELRELERTYLATIRRSGDFDVTLWQTGNMTDPLWILDPWHTVPTRWESSFAPAWAEWYTSQGQRGEEPPPEAKRIFELWETTVTSLDEEEVVQAGLEALRIHIENAWSIGTVGLVPAPVIASNRLRNIPETGVLSYDWVFLARYNPEQFFLTD